MPGGEISGADPIAGGHGGGAACRGPREGLYRLAGEIVCVEQGVANRVEMCVAHMRNEVRRDGSAGMPGDSAREAPKAEAAALGRPN